MNNCDHTGKIELTCIGDKWLHEKCGEFVDSSKIIRKESEECECKDYHHNKCPNFMSNSENKKENVSSSQPQQNDSENRIINNKKEG